MSVEARLQAARALGRVLRRGAWSNLVVGNGADRAAIQALVLGALRWLPMIDAAISRAGRRNLGSIDDDLLDLLRVVAGEIWSRPGRPIPVVVDTGVRAATQLEPRYRGFANAVLRRLAEMEPETPQTPGQRGIPEWLSRLMGEVLPDDHTALWEALDVPAPVGLRSTSPVAGASAVRGIPGAWLWTGGPPPAGAEIQDPASVAVGNVVDARPGMLVLDMAAAPGGKTRHLLEQVGPEGRVVAADLHRRRVMTASRRTPAASWLVASGGQPPFRAGIFDRVLVDAPCTGLGTLRRRPEIRYRVTREEMTRLALVQRDLLRNALRLVKPGGRVVYSVCTFTPQETMEVTAGLGGRVPIGIPGREWGDGWLMSPLDGPVDGMFLVVFDR